MSSALYRRAVTIAATFFLAAGCGTNSHSQSTGRTADRQTTSVSDDVVATVGGQPITLSAVDEKLLRSKRDVLQALFEARREALGELIADALLEAEAERRGVSRDELEQAEILSKLAPVTDEDVEAFFAQNESRLGGQTLEQIGPQIREFLVSRAEQTERRRFLEDLHEQASVSIELEPPRVPIQVADGERIRGPKDAPVTIVEYSDFQ